MIDSNPTIIIVLFKSQYQYHSGFIREISLIMIYNIQSKKDIKLNYKKFKVQFELRKTRINFQHREKTLEPIVVGKMSYQDPCRENFSPRSSFLWKKLLIKQMNQRDTQIVSVYSQKSHDNNNIMPLDKFSIATKRIRDFFFYYF